MIAKGHLERGIIQARSLLAEWNFFASQYFIISSFIVVYLLPCVIYVIERYLTQSVTCFEDKNETRQHITKYMSRALSLVSFDVLEFVFCKQNEKQRHEIERREPVDCPSQRQRLKAMRVWSCLVNIVYKQAKKKKKATFVHVQWFSILIVYTQILNFNFYAMFIHGCPKIFSSLILASYIRISKKIYLNIFI